MTKININYGTYIKNYYRKEFTFKLHTKRNFKLVITINYQLSSAYDTVEI